MKEFGKMLGLFLMRRILHYFLNRWINASPLEKLTQEQNAKFTRLGLDRQKAHNKLREIEDDFSSVWKNQPYGMSSEHLILFSSISIEKKNVKKILEIGTFQGQTTILLSKLFPEAQIETLDLTTDEVRKNQVYSYGIGQLSSNQDSGTKIAFLTLNSLNLLNFSGKYDLIWVDGNHLSPYTISDIVNSVRLLASDGYLICDDVYLKKPFLEVNADLSTISILRSLSDSQIISFDLILKRLGRRTNNVISGRKYIAIARKLI